MVQNMFELFGINSVPSQANMPQQLYGNEEILCRLEVEKMKGMRRKCIRFAKDGNHVARPYVTVYPVSEIVSDGSLISWYLEFVPDAYGNTDIRLYNDIGPILVYHSWVASYWTVDKLRCVMRDCMNRAGVQGFLHELETLFNTGQHISMVQIEALKEIGEGSLAAKYSAYRDKRNALMEQRRDEALKQQQQQEKEEQELREREIQACIEQAEADLLAGKTIKNEKLDGVSLLLRLMRKYKINVALATQGWINQKLASVSVQKDGSVHYSYIQNQRGRKGGSTVFCQHMVALRNVIMEKR